MKTTWTRRDARNHFSQVIEQALQHGPQIITRRGEETAVLISAEMFRAWSGQEQSLVDFMRRSPLYGVDLDVLRRRNMGRSMSL
jgi:prevent-host-death family protein